MDECIKREDAIRVVKKYFTDFLGLNPDICIAGIRSLPAADVVEYKGDEGIADLKALGVITCCEDCKFLRSTGCDSVQCTKTGNTFYVWDVGGWGNPDIRHPTCPFPKLENLIVRKKG